MNDENEPLSFLRVVEFTVAALTLAILSGAWVYSWFRGSLLAQFWYGG